MNIDKNKVLSNESLLALRGGDELNPCGEGFVTFCCLIIPPGSHEIEGMLCAEEGQSWQAALQAAYPGAEGLCIPGTC